MKMVDMGCVLAFLESVAGADPDKHRAYNGDDDADGDEDPSRPGKPCLSMGLWILGDCEAGGVPSSGAAALLGSRTTRDATGNGTGGNRGAGHITLVNGLDIDITGIALLPFRHEHPEHQVDQCTEPKGQDREDDADGPDHCRVLPQALGNATADTCNDLVLASVEPLVRHLNQPLPSL